MRLLRMLLRFVAFSCLLWPFFLSVRVDAQTVPPGASNLSGSLSQGTITLNWSGVPDANGNYYIYRSVDGGPFGDLYSGAYAGLPNSTRTYSLGAENGHTYAFQVRATNSAGSGPPSNTVTISVQLAAPTLTATLTNGTVILNWSAVPEANGYYYAYVSKDGVPFGAPISGAYASTYATSVNVGAENGHTYAYYVHAFNSAGRGLPSNIVTKSVNLEAAMGFLADLPEFCPTV